MEAILLGFALGAGTVYVVRRSRAQLKAAAGWTVRQVGWVSGQVTNAVDQARRTVREHYQRGREENLAKFTELPPPSSAEPNGKSAASAGASNGTTASGAAEARTSSPP